MDKKSQIPVPSRIPISKEAKGPQNSVWNKENSTLVSALPRKVTKNTISKGKVIPQNASIQNGKRASLITVASKEQEDLTKGIGPEVPIELDRLSRISEVSDEQKSLTQQASTGSIAITATSAAEPVKSMNKEDAKLPRTRSAASKPTVARRSSMIPQAGTSFTKTLANSHTGPFAGRRSMSYIRDDKSGIQPVTSSKMRPFGALSQHTITKHSTVAGRLPHGMIAADDKDTSVPRRKFDSAVEGVSTILTAVQQKNREADTVKEEQLQQLQTEKGKWGIDRQKLLDQVQHAELELAKVQSELKTTNTRAADLQKQLELEKLARESEDQYHTLQIEQLTEKHKFEVDGLIGAVAKAEDECELANREIERLKRVGRADKSQLERQKEVLETQNASYYQKLQKLELTRRRLHNELQDLKGNIRVFCRIRPSIPSEQSKELARFVYPDADDDSRQVVLCDFKHGHNRNNTFTFDRVFTPVDKNEDLFLEMSQLVQSALDGHNVCIFAYGQTGSGKTYTMSAPNEGMIPRAVTQIFETTQELAASGWQYELTGEFVEIYNESLRDLLVTHPNGAASVSKLEIRHEPIKRTTAVVNLTVNVLDSIDAVKKMLKIAEHNRSVAATKINERSSRSHSVFTLRIKGSNKALDKSCSGILNLIDLAGSERLSESQTVGAQRRETQHINKSLSALGDVIYALGRKNGSKDGHVPYRNSKLTYLLQYSLSGSSKTLMLVNVSPLGSHVDESISSLRFAANVNATRLN